MWSPLAGPTSCWRPRSGSLFADGEQRGVAAGGRRVDGHRAFAGKAQQVVRTTGLGPGPRQAFATKRLHANDSADLVAVDVAIAYPRMTRDVFHRVIDAAVHAERQAIAGAVDLVDDLVQVLCLVADQVQHRPKDFAFQRRQRRNLIGAWRKEGPVCG